MWISLLILLGFCNGVLSANPLCQRTASRACLIGEEDFVAFPKNENELQDLCKFAKTTLQCTVNFVDQCGKGNFDLLEANYGKIEKLRDATADICQTGSQLYSRVVGVLPCASRVLRNDEVLCGERTTHARVKLEIITENNSNTETESGRLRQLFDCLEPILNANCFLVQTLKKCGPQARDTVLDIMRRVGLLETECTASFRDEILQLLEIAQFLTEEEMYVDQLL